MRLTWNNDGTIVMSDGDAPGPTTEVHFSAFGESAMTILGVAIFDDRTGEVVGEWEVDEHGQLVAVEPPPDDDTRPLDLFPDDCWRCDAREAETEVGLCLPCRADLEPPKFRGSEPVFIILDEVHEFDASDVTVGQCCDVDHEQGWAEVAPGIFMPRYGGIHRFTL